MKKEDLYRFVEACLHEMSQKDCTDASSVSNRSVNFCLKDPISPSDLTVRTVCSLWANKGHIYHVTVRGRAKNEKALPTTMSMIVKHIAAPSGRRMTVSDERKLRSYQVEANFYQHLAPKLLANSGLRVPRPYRVERREPNGGEILIGMSYIPSDCHSLDFDMSSPSGKTMVHAALAWLAALHGSYWGGERSSWAVKQYGLQPIGTYWYLDTRAEEHARMPDGTGNWEGRMKLAARAISDYIHGPGCQDCHCIVHGDAKDANMFFQEASNDNESNAAVGFAMCDFQYCGKAIPTLDVAYFLCSSVGGNQEQIASCFQYYTDQLTDRIHRILASERDAIGPPIAAPPTRERMEDLLDLAYCDFYRFMSGWGFWGSGGMERVMKVLNRLDGGAILRSEDEYVNAVQREYNY